VGPIQLDPIEVRTGQQAAFEQGTSQIGTPQIGFAQNSLP